MTRFARRLGQQAPVLSLVGAQHVGLVALGDPGQLLRLDFPWQRQVLAAVEIRKYLAGDSGGTGSLKG